jgi:SAM-dependent methyltransferase
VAPRDKHLGKENAHDGKHASRDWAAYYQQLRDRPPRRTLLAALDAFGSPPPDALVIDLGCGDGRDAIEKLRRGWHVIAVDSNPKRCASCRLDRCRTAAT